MRRGGSPALQLVYRVRREALPQQTGPHSLASPGLPAIVFGLAWCLSAKRKLSTKDSNFHYRRQGQKEDIQDFLSRPCFIVC